MDFTRAITAGSMRVFTRINCVALATIFLALLASGTITAMQAQTPADQLAKPPASAQAFTILSSAGTHGHAYIWKAEDGSTMSRDSLLLRGQVWEVEQTVVLGADRMPSKLVVRGVSPQGDVAESF